MSTPAHTESLQQELPPPHWSPTKRIAFRFCFVYFGLYCLTTQIIGDLIPVSRDEDLPSLGVFWPVRQIVMWTGAHIFHIGHPLSYADTGSGDKTYDWVLAFCVLVIAVASTVVWSALDRKRENYATLYKWFRLFIRLALAAEMFSYGMAKVIPSQMPFPRLTKLLEPFGKLSPMGLLWASIGASPAYEIFAGSGEMLGGILLINARTTILGALLTLAVSTHVFVLNMTYDVPVKLLSFHLILMALFLLAPEIPRLLNFFVMDRAVGRSTQPTLFGRRRSNQIAVTVQIVLGICLLVATGSSSWKYYSSIGRSPKSALYGIWTIEQLSSDGQIRAPLLTDNDRWQRAIFDFPESMLFQRMNGSYAGYNATINDTDKTLVLSKNSDKTWKADFHYQRAAADELILDGDMDGHKIHMQLRLTDLNSFLLVSRGFHWISERPFNR